MKEMHVYIENLHAFVGETVTVKGWLYHRTDKGKLRFLLVRDGTGTVQAVVFKRNVAEEDFEAASSVTQESSIIVTGTVREDSRAPGGYELDASAFLWSNWLTNIRLRRRSMARPS